MLPIQNRRKAAAWTAANPTLRQGELALETDTGLLKVGDGAAAWTSLIYVSGNIVSLLGLADDAAARAAIGAQASILGAPAGSVASSATPSIDADVYAVYAITALAADITGVTISGTPADQQRLTIPITDNGTSRAITWGSSFVGRLLLKTTPNQHHFQELVYSSSLGKWVGEYASEPSTAWGPRDSGLLAWAFDPAAATGSTISTLGKLQLVKVKVTPGIPISNIHIGLATIGASLSNAFMALYHPTTGAKLRATADLTTAWNSTVGNRTHALTSSYTPTTEYLYVGFYSYASSGTAPTFARAANSDLVNFGLSSGAYRFCTADTGLTTALPDPFGAQTAAAVAYWVGLS